MSTTLYYRLFPLWCEFQQHFYFSIYWAPTKQRKTSVFFFFFLVATYIFIEEFTIFGIMPISNY